jgi:putative N-acetyltransferase (TIGR04045 family)
MISSSAPTAEIALAADLEAHLAVRHRVFVELQGLFPVSDRDAYDDDPATLHVVACVDGEVVGTVRLYPLGDGLWKGDRLAVLPDARVHRLGGALVRFAVRTAGELGGRVMVAQVQVPNVRFFERLGWACDGDAAPYCGVMHQPMAIPLGP